MGILFGDVDWDRDGSSKIEPIPTEERNLFYALDTLSNPDVTLIILLLPVSLIRTILIHVYRHLKIGKRSQ